MAARRPASGREPGQRGRLNCRRAGKKARRQHFAVEVSAWREVRKLTPEREGKQGREARREALSAAPCSDHGDQTPLLRLEGTVAVLNYTAPIPAVVLSALL